MKKPLGQKVKHLQETETSQLPTIQHYATQNQYLVAR